ncbi:hypothetical protein ESB00_02495 [Oleiharenicola lentus]|jgi:hypothetical protein|uniref:PEP-CTERM sorting domain-containing protein n=1 Tax=Oleiharenicola lentus TaxID=2508720 RepID=A0A4Q1C7J0_9BACT|nr:hypothetical protein [Oleiharenicola lentus]RXK54786.1 hypothetical protein ESB00_02495 [Oleiharenicola lentus]
MHLLRALRTSSLWLAAALASQALASPILYYTPSLVSNGLGKPSSSQFTTAVTNAFGAGNVIEIPTFNNAADFDDGAALFVNARLGADSLSAAEKSNLFSFINDGGAVFFIGDHSGWTTWDDSFLNLFGDSFLHWNGVNAASLVTGNAPAQFASAGQVLLSAPGAIAGGNGKKLYTVFGNGGGRAMSALYGPEDNAIAFLDTSALSGNTASHLAFYSGLSSWLFETASAYELSKQPVVTPPSGNTVPDSMPVLAIAPVLFGFAWFRRRVRI